MFTVVMTYWVMQSLVNYKSLFNFRNILGWTSMPLIFMESWCFSQAILLALMGWQYWLLERAYKWCKGFFRVIFLLFDVLQFPWPISSVRFSLFVWSCLWQRCSQIPCPNILLEYFLSPFLYSCLQSAFLGQFRANGPVRECTGGVLSSHWNPVGEWEQRHAGLCVRSQQAVAVAGLLVMSSAGYLIGGDLSFFYMVFHFDFLVLLRCSPLLSPVKK